MRVLIAAILSLFLFLLCNNPQKGEMDKQNYTKMEKNNNSSMCAKQPMTADGIVRLSKIEVYPQYLNEYMQYAVEVGEISLRTEPGVLTMYAVQDKENPTLVTILETYVSQAAYRSHVASAHFQKYKQGTLHMVKSLQLCDQTPLNPANKIDNYIE
ncbi:antibiotic biosynthesis monooxygenase [Parabacteroides distasonis]|nr:antibiotic biosynthesis monooxygenase [Parabacteroides distasonis]